MWIYDLNTVFAFGMYTAMYKLISIFLSVIQEGTGDNFKYKAIIDGLGRTKYKGKDDTET